MNGVQSLQQGHKMEPGQVERFNMKQKLQKLQKGWFFNGFYIFSSLLAARPALTSSSRLSTDRVGPTKRRLQASWRGPRVPRHGPDGTEKTVISWP